MKIFAQISYGLSGLFVLLGLYKLYAYKNDDYDNLINAYVEGDAWNMLINKGFATSYFLLALVCVVTGTSIFVYEKLNAIHRTLKGEPEPIVEDSSDDVEYN
ncbi:hypothetical protein QU593_09975 [Rossellomorea marisflavi]|uniref:hypothetical protein n=1 Tax=Rossellomorea marisflavi TaxID=189381 RepID=UPI0025AF6ED6|nr:hypothetical protein [Rossellomorea marisflavi]WJV20731.1 hypothetical protein QU593_09975 [Rossellomorea marisflavi]